RWRSGSSSPATNCANSGARGGAGESRHGAAHRARLPPWTGRAHDHARRRRRARPDLRARAGPRQHRALRAHPGRVRARRPHERGDGRMLSRPDMPPPNGPLNGWVRLLGLVGVPGAISLYLVWWVTAWVGAKLDRIIQLLEQIARALHVAGV